MSAITPLQLNHFIFNGLSVINYLNNAHTATETTKREQEINAIVFPLQNAVDAAKNLLQSVVQENQGG